MGCFGQSSESAPFHWIIQSHRVGRCPIPQQRAIIVFDLVHSVFGMILLIDNYDSFVNNIARYLRRLGVETIVRRNREINEAEVLELKPSAIVVSPGPCAPRQAGNSENIVQAVAGKIPVLGICLGHQVIASAFGAKIIHAPEPYHGRQSLIRHEQHFLFDSVPTEFLACRYHSLVVEETSLPESLVVTCRTEDGIIMGIADDIRMLHGLQFHPESILTEHGFPILGNFVRHYGIVDPGRPTPTFESEYCPDSMELAKPKLQKDRAVELGTGA